MNASKRAFFEWLVKKWNKQEEDSNRDQGEETKQKLAA